MDTDVKELKNQINDMWQRFSDYKETAEQHEFALIMAFDVALTKQYEDLKVNWTEEHARLFLKNITFTFKTLGIQ